MSDPVAFQFDAFENDAFQVGAGGPAIMRITITCGSTCNKQTVRSFVDAQTILSVCPRVSLRSSVAAQAIQSSTVPQRIRSSWSLL